MSDYVLPEDFKYICEEFLYETWNSWIMDNDINLENNDLDWWRDNYGNGDENDEFIEWISEDNKKDLFKCSTNIFDVIKYINSYYNNNYGNEFIMDYNKLNEDFILRNLFYVYCQEYLEDFIEKMKQKTLDDKDVDDIFDKLCV